MIVGCWNGRRWTFSVNQGRHCHFHSRSHRQSWVHLHRRRSYPHHGQSSATTQPSIETEWTTKYIGLSCVTNKTRKNSNDTDSTSSGVHLAIQYRYMRPFSNSS